MLRVSTDILENSHAQYDTYDKYEYSSSRSTPGEKIDTKSLLLAHQAPRGRHLLRRSAVSCPDRTATLILVRNDLQFVERDALGQKLIGCNTNSARRSGTPSPISGQVCRAWLRGSRLVGPGSEVGGGGGERNRCLGHMSHEIGVLPGEGKMREESGRAP